MAMTWGPDSYSVERPRDPNVVELHHSKLGAIYMNMQKPDEVESAKALSVGEFMRSNFRSNSSKLGLNNCRTTLKGNVGNEFVTGVIEERGGDRYDGGFHSTLRVMTYIPAGNGLVRVTGYMRLEYCMYGARIRDAVVTQGYWFQPGSRMPELIELAKEFRIDDISRLQRTQRETGKPAGHTPQNSADSANKSPSGWPMVKRHVKNRRPKFWRRSLNRQLLTELHSNKPIEQDDEKPE